MEIGIKRINQ